MATYSDRITFLSKELKAVLLMCEIHSHKQLGLFCKDHRQLCCSKCVSLSHSQCSNVTQISELTNTQPTDLQGLSGELETVLVEIKNLQISQGLSIQSLRLAYKEHKEFITNQMLININTTIDECGNSSVSTSDTNEPCLKQVMCRSVLSILNEFDKYIVKELNEMKDEVKSIKGSVTSSIHKCTSLHNDLSQFLEIVQKIGDNKEVCLIASIRCKHIIQKAWAVLGKSGKAFNVQRKSQHNVKMPSDADTCWIIAISALPDGQVLVADRQNDNVKLLNKQYQVVSHWGVTACIWDMCQITPSEVAVAVTNNASNKHEVQFITVTQNQLSPGRKLELQHECRGIAHHQGELFISSGTALYTYSLSGKLVCRLYEVISAETSVYKCAVSPTGDKLYIINSLQHKLLTLARNGTRLATYTDPDREGPSCVHVTPAGQVLVCGYLSHTILHVDSEGRRKLATLSTGRYEVWCPESICYCSPSSCIIVGQRASNYILVYKVE